MKHNFEDMIHIVKKINFFLGMCMQDVDHTNYSDDAKMLLKFAINTHGATYLNQLMDSIKLAETVNNLKGGDNWDPSKKALDEVQEEWNAGFKNVGKKSFKTENLFSDGQESKEDAEKSGGDSEGPSKGAEGQVPGA